MHTPPFRALLTWFLGLLVVVALVGAVIVVGERQEAEASRIRADTRAYEKSAALRQAALDREAEDHAARVRAAQERKAEKRAAELQAAADKESEEQAAREEAAAEKAAQEKAAEEAAAAAAAEAAASHVLTGAVLVPDVNGALVTQIGGHPGQPLTDFTEAKLATFEKLLASLSKGKTYPCPGGSGGDHDDVVAGAPVAVHDGDGNALATTKLVGGTLTAQGCIFTFGVKVSGADLYEVTVTQRDALTFSRTDLEAHGWAARIDL